MVEAIWSQERFVIESRFLLKQEEAISPVILNASLGTSGEMRRE
jgi:hypothetical protein